MAYATAMAWVESAAVVYLRTVVGAIDPYQPNSTPDLGQLTWVEIVREAATLVMLFSVGWLAGETWRSRLGYTLIAFGWWDIAYYIFLKPMCGWPHSIWDWDILFLIPLPWWGPVIAPAAIAVLMIACGTLIAAFDQPGAPVWPSRRATALNLAGIALALYVFMSDAIRALPRGADAVRAARPAHFNWPLFLVALAFMAVPLVDLTGQARRRGR